MLSKKKEGIAEFLADLKEIHEEYAQSVVSNPSGNSILETSLSALEEIAHKDKNLFHRIIEAVKRFISNIKGNKTTRKLEADLERLEAKLQKVYENAEIPVDIINKNVVKYSLQNEYRTNAMIWANAADRKAGDCKLLNRNGKDFALIEADGEGGYTEFITGKYSEVKSEYDEYISEQTDKLDEVVEDFRSGQRQYYGNSRNDENGRRNAGNIRPIRGKTIQNNAAGNNEYLRSSDKGSYTELNYQTEASEEGAFSMQKNITESESFEKWFGDSKAVNKDGTPKKLYHRTNADFTVFDTERSGSNQGKTKGDGIYLSSSKDEFSYAGNKVMELYVSVKSPFEMELSEEEANQIYDKYFKPYHEDKYNTYRPHVISSLTNPVKVFDYLSEAAEKNNTKTSTILSELGYDGVHSGSEWVAFNPEQVKSADPVTYDDNGNVIPLSERFNAENEDIRYSLKGDRLEELRYRPEMFAKRLIKKFSLIGVDVDELAGKLRELVVKHNKGGKDFEIMKMPTKIIDK
ncbi:MAG: hypothetical protein J5659_04340 [Clostridia bacterium]|nr:hypothetical protein [Clostridia bacterium]